ncbi:MAG: ABC transporter ATP-binding protein, partial [Acidobacteriota bacterium]
WLCEALEAPQRPWVEGLLARLDVSGQRAQRVRVSLLRERLRRARVGGCWLLRLPPGASFWQQMRDAGLPWQMGRFLVFYAASYSLMLLSWWMLGRGALAGHLSQDWLLAWALVLLSLVLPQQASIWAQARLAAGAGTLLKRRLLQGALKLEPDEIRHQGAGQLLGRVIESEAMQTHALLGGFLAALGGVELLISAWVLAQGAAGWWHVGLLAVWLAATLTLGWRFFVLRRRWTEDRLEMTNDLVESLVGHRTRLAQERQESWHQREDRLLERYLTSSRTMDSQRTWLVVSSFAWVSVGIVGLLPAFVLGQGSTATLALAVGGILLASRAFNKLSRGFTHLTGAWISWRQAAPIFRAAARAQPGAAAGRVELPSRQAETPEATPEPSTPEPSTPEPVTPEPLLEAQDLVYRYRDRARPVLDGCNVRIHRGDRILLEGPSGGGKSTLAAILTRLRPPDSGLLLLGGLDRHTVGSDVWRQHIVSAPQFHENHVFTETFAFNLLMGRGWPPSPKDMAEATAVCEELGLGELLERMPAGLLQVVGETGWQLSHGERSRLFMARALLQGTEIVILDESFAALDPENFQRALHSALKRAPTLMVIAHP